MIRGKLTSALTGGFARGFLWGAGVALGATLLVPGVRKRVRPLLVRAASGAISLRDEIEAQTVVLREDLQDIVAEARHERDRMQEAAATAAAAGAAGPATAETEAQEEPEPDATSEPAEEGGEEAQG
jgi:hypothetical protein